MPYIKAEERVRWEKGLQSLIFEMQMSTTPGDLNYLMTRLVHAYIKYRGLNYTHLNDVVGVFDSAKAEFQRRVVGPYEDSKIETNGDVP